MSTTYTATIWIERNGRDFEVEIEAEYHAGVDGSRDCYGLASEPDEPERMEIVVVRDPETDQPVRLTREERKKADVALFQQRRREAFAI